MNWKQATLNGFDLSIRLCLVCFGLVSTVSLSVTIAMEQSIALPARDGIAAAREFEDHIERFLKTLPLTREKQEVRIIRCQSPQGDMRDDVYALWIGARLVAPGNDAGAVLADVRVDWLGLGWTLTRDRRLDNGGRNLAATQPGRGYHYNLDSGFAGGPNRYVVGYFTTPCFKDPSGTAPFGALRAD